MGYEIGQVVGQAAERPRVQCGPVAPAWYALLARPQREASAEAWLRANGVAAWFPTEDRYRQAGGRRVRYGRRIAPGYIFARFVQAPVWARLFSEEPGARYLRGVVGMGASPIRLADEDMARIEGLPLRMMESRAEMLERARAARMVREGDMVRVQGGAMDGWVVEVASVHAGIARLLVPLLGADSVSCPVDGLVPVPRA